MSAGSNGQQNFRKAMGAIKDSTMVSIAKVNSVYKELDVAILKATTHVEALPKEKHVRTILGAVSGSRPRADVVYCIDGLSRRLAKTHTWTVALKTLIVIHRALREVDHSFCEELICYNHSRGHMLNLLHFKDDSSPSAWDYSTWICSYALYLGECLECFRVLKYDFHRDHSRTKKFDTPALLEQLPALQQLLFRLLACQPIGAAQYNFMIQYALSIVAAESVRLYVAITDGVLNLVDKYFEMQRHDAVRALEIYRKSGDQAQRLSNFFEMCRCLDFGRRQKYVKIDQPPASFLASMEEYVKDTPQTLMLPWREDDDERRVISEPASNLDTDIGEESNPATISPKGKETDKGAEPAPLIPDLLSWDEDEILKEASESTENATPCPSATEPEASDSANNSELSSQPACWELALVTDSVAQSKGRVLDRLTLDSLYDQALTTTNQNGAYQMGMVPSNPFEAGYNQEIKLSVPNQEAEAHFHNPAQIPQHQATGFIGLRQQHLQEQLHIGHDYAQIAGILQQQAEFQENAHQHQGQAMVSSDFMQIAGFSQAQSLTQHAQPIFGQESTKSSRNPFLDQDSPSQSPPPPPQSPPPPPQSPPPPPQSSNASLI